MPKWIIQLSISLILGIMGQLFLKEGASKLDLSAIKGAGNLFIFLWKIVSNYQLVVGLTFYGLSAVFYILVLKQKDLSLVYPMVGASYVLVLLFSWLFRHEMVSPVRWLGALVITLGVFLISRS